MSEYTFKVVQKVRIRSFIKKISVITSIIFFILLSMLFLPWEQTVTGHGKLIAYDPLQRDYTIVSTVNGFVEEYYVHENQEVKKGDILCKIVDKDSNLSTTLNSQERLLSTQLSDNEAQSELLESQIGSLESYYKNGLNVYDSKLLQSDQKIKTLQFSEESLRKNLEVKENKYNRIDKLKNLGIESLQNLEYAQNEYVTIKMEVEKNSIEMAIERQNYTILEDEKRKFIDETQNKIKQLKAKLLQTNIALSSIKNALLKLKSDTNRYESRLIRASKDGTVVRLLQNDSNKLLKEGDEIIHFAPALTQRSLLLRVSDFNMPLMRENLKVRIKFYGWPALQISGWPTIKYGTFGGYVKKVEPLSYEEGAYYIHVFETKEEPWPDKKVLRLGTQATAWVRLESVPIWYQIWRYINAMPPNMLLEMDNHEEIY